ncbi:MAG: Holliday junction branch migration protein RuvA [Lachnospiraceae bacterium]|nr:Holliday junction branch migration protein RuvA [Lachnospiraceae bacterium]
MIAYVKGIIDSITDDTVVVDVGGIGYNIKISESTARLLPGIGQSVKMHTYTLVREDAFMLYGFLSRDDLDIFKKCITVNGIGPKGALAILSVMDASELRIAIVSGDAKAISKAPGIGGKTAERLILDLKDKISIEEALYGGLDSKPQVASASLDDVNVKEAIEALVALGYGQAEATKAVGSIEHAEELDSGQLLKIALKNLF